MHYGCQLVPSLWAHPEKQDIKILTYNIFGNANEQRRQEVIETIRREQPDIVCCTEYRPRNDGDIFERTLGDLYPYSVSNMDKNSWGTGELILSRFPVNTKHINDFDPGDAIIAQMDVRGAKVDIVTVHLERIGRQIRRHIMDSSRSLREKVTTVSEIEMLKDTTKFTHAQKLLDTLALFQNPLIICGDFNDTPNSRVYHLFSRNYVNTFSSAGWGLGATFGESWMRIRMRNIPFFSFFGRDILRIDHIFVSRDFDTISSKVITDAEGSDHKPVISVVRIKSTD
jgi:endonuclease/exonuclease/phosphatase family metal-dependent hydrolase